MIESKFIDFKCFHMRSIRAAPTRPAQGRSLSGHDSEKLQRNVHDAPSDLDSRGEAFASERGGYTLNGCQTFSRKSRSQNLALDCLICAIFARQRHSTRCSRSVCKADLTLQTREQWLTRHEGLPLCSPRCSRRMLQPLR